MAGPCNAMITRAGLSCNGGNSFVTGLLQWGAT
jgi:hypothetical protein